MKMHKGNIEADVDKMVKMSKGNPGAARALVELVQVSPSAVNYLDKVGIHGTDIYVLWSDICDKNAIRMHDILRSAELGNLSEAVLRDACGRQDYSGKQLIKDNMV